METLLTLSKDLQEEYGMPYFTRTLGKDRFEEFLDWFDPINGEITRIHETGSTLHFTVSFDADGCFSAGAEIRPDWISHLHVCKVKNTLSVYFSAR